MASLRLQVGDTVVYDGPPVAVPRSGDDIRHEGSVVRIESVAWDFTGEDGAVVVTLVLADRPYTY